MEVHEKQVILTKIIASEGKILVSKSKDEEIAIATSKGWTLI